MIELHRHASLAELRIQHEKPLNPFTRHMTRELIGVCAEVEADDALAAAVIWGGAGRSFSVGGDFADLRRIEGPEAGAEYLRDIVRSYQAVLGISKPVVVAVDHHAIGQGLQVALMGDWRMGSERSLYQMPELAGGVPCPLGSAILEALLGRAAMLHLVIGCGKLDAEGARRERLIDEVRPHGELWPAAAERAEKLAGFPAKAYRLTKQIQNRRMIQHLEDVREVAARAHAESFFSGQADEHFSSILGDRQLGEALAGRARGAGTRGDPLGGRRADLRRAGAARRARGRRAAPHAAGHGGRPAHRQRGRLPGGLLRLPAGGAHARCCWTSSAGATSWPTWHGCWT